MRTQGIGREHRATADGALGNAVMQSFNPNKMRQDGWTTDLKSQGSSTVLRMSKKLTGSGTWPPSSGGATASTTSDTKFDFKVNDGLLYRITMPPSQVTPATLAKTDAERQGQQLGEQLVRSSFQMAWTINLPGEITDTNADSRTDHGGTWEIGIDRLQNGLDMRISSRERKGTTILLAGGVVVLAVVVAAVYWVRSGRGRSRGEFSD